MSVVLDRQYEFVPPYRGNLWPTCIQRLRLVDRYLRKKEGVVTYECRDLDRFRQSIDRGDGILLAPNHCRYADPLVLGWPAREIHAHVYAMASWHLFNKGRFDSFAIRRMGAFSINREGTDRQSLEAAIEILQTAERPLILFPEGTTNRTNDVIKPLLDGVAFIARSAARRRAKAGAGNVVMHPVAIKYLCKSDCSVWADAQLSELEHRFCWRKHPGQTLLQRTTRVVEGFLALKEIEYLGASRAGCLTERRHHLIRWLLKDTEQRLGIQSSAESDGRERVRAIRSDIVAKYFALPEGSREREDLRQDVASTDLVLDLLSYPDDYLNPDSVTDTRVVETIQRMQEFHCGKADNTMPLHVVIQFGAAIAVPAAKPPRGEVDPIMVELREHLSTMIKALAAEARSLSQA